MDIAHIYSMSKIEAYAQGAHAWHEPLKGGTYMRQERGQFLVVKILFLIKNGCLCH